MTVGSLTDSPSRRVSSIAGNIGVAAFGDGVGSGRTEGGAVGTISRCGVGRLLCLSAPGALNGAGRATPTIVAFRFTGGCGCGCGRAAGAALGRGSDARATGDDDGAAGGADAAGLCGGGPTPIVVAGLWAIGAGGPAARTAPTEAPGFGTFATGEGPIGIVFSSFAPPGRPPSETPAPTVLIGGVDAGGKDDFADAGAGAEGEAEGTGGRLAGAAAWTPRNVVGALGTPAGLAASSSSAAGSDVYALPASDFDVTSFSITTREASSILMNFTPIPAGLSGPACVGSRFQTTRPTPEMTLLSPASRISNFRSVPGGKGVGVLTKMPPLLTSCEWFSMNSSTVALL